MSKIINTVSVSTVGGSYDILIGSGLLSDAADFITPVLQQKKVVIVSDENVAKIYLEPLEKSLAGQGVQSSAIILPAGEQTKSFDNLQLLLNRLLDEKPERGITLIALGGGVIGDITGFAASVLLRGVGFIQIPTTLLAQVDSSVGGKTGINTAHGKNLIGSFYQPNLVLADLDTLSTLPERELKAGYAEVVKYGIIRDAQFFEWLEENGANVIAQQQGASQREVMAYAVARSCQMKAEIVGRDERESGERALLNFGHTFGHALEAECGYSSELLHGEAVGIGMVIAARLSANLGLCAEDVPLRITRHLRDVGLKSEISDIGVSRQFNAEDLYKHMLGDKKVKDGAIRFILLKRIGAAFSSDPIEKSKVLGVLV